MEKNRNIKLYIMFALIISVMGLSIAYAAYSTTLTIKGTVTARKSSDVWNVHFEALDGGTTLTPILTGNAREITPPTLTDTKISGFEASFYAPGDSVRYEFNIVNSGLLDAKLSSSVIGSLTCTPKANGTATASEATALCNDLILKVEQTSANPDTSLVLTSGQSINYHLSVTWNEASTVTISDDITVTIEESNFVFTQD